MVSRVDNVELLGRNYTNTIVQRSKTYDRVGCEHVDEDISHVIRSAFFDRTTLRRKYGPTAWLPYYLFVMRRCLNQAAATARVKIKQGDPACIADVFRRLVSFIHQEVELLSQGEKVWDAAREEGSLVMFGRP
jgi:hypothetical protein